MIKPLAWRVRGAVAAFALLLTALPQLSFNAHAQGACLVPGDSGPEALLDGLGCVTAVASDAEFQVNWHLSESDVNRRPVTVTLTAAPAQTVTLSLVVPGLAGAAATLTSADGAKATTVWPLLPAEYELRFTVSGQEGRFVFDSGNPGSSVTFSTSPTGPDGRPTRQSGEFDQIGSLFTAPDYIHWTVPESVQDGQAWRVALTGTPGFPVTVKLYDESGTELLHDSVPAGGRLDLTDLELVEGIHTFVLSPVGDVSQAGYRLQTSLLGPFADGNKQGRTGSRSGANRIDLSGGVSGNLDEDRQDYYHLRVDAAEAGHFDLDLAVEGQATLCIEDQAGSELACHSFTDVLAVPLLRLDEGEYWFRIAGNRTDQAAYSLSFTEVAPPDADNLVVGPAGSRAGAFPLPGSGTARFTHGGRTTTWLALELPDSGLYRVQLLGTGDVRDLRISDGGGTTVRTGGSSQSRLDNVPLRSGLNYVSVDAFPGDYSVRVMRLGDLPREQAPQPAAAAAELTLSGEVPAELDHQEVAARPAGVIVPGVNHEQRSAVRIDAGKDYAATSDGPDAHYRFTLLNDARVMLTLTPPEDAEMRLRLLPAQSGQRTSATPGEPLVIDHWLSAGDYRVEVRMNGESSGWYTLRLDLLDPFDLPLGLRPFDPPNARPVPADLTLDVPASGEDMYFRLPVLESAATLRVDVRSGPASAIWVLPVPETGRSSRLPLTVPEGEEDAFTVGLEPDVEYYVVLGAAPDEAWNVSFDFGEGLAARAVTHPREQLGLSVELETDSVAAWSRFGQVVSGTLSVESDADSALTLAPVVHASDPRATVSGLPESLEVGAGASIDVPFTLTLPDDLRGDRPFSLTLGLANGDGLTATAAAELVATCDALTLGAHAWTPAPFLDTAYWNYALAPLGTSISSSANTRRDPLVIDGRVAVSQPGTFPVGEEFWLDLGREATVQAVALHPVGGGTEHQLRDFEIRVSADGEDWTTVLEGSLTGAAIEQVFTLPATVDTRHISLRLLDSQHRGQRNISVGEFKVLGSEPPLDRINLADPQFGGHVVRGNAWIGMSTILEGPASGPSATRPNIAMRSIPGPLEFVLGFHENRAALISSFEWQDYELRNNHTYLPGVSVSVSTESPLGPWQHVADWHFERPEGGSLDTPPVLALELSEPAWARFVRFEELGELVDDDRRQLNLPAPLRVFEHDEGDGYRSILGEWGMDRQSAIYERLHPELAELAGVSFGDNGTMDSARALDGESSGFVQAGSFTAWYEITVPADANRLHLDVGSGTSVELGFELTDAGQEILASGVSGQPLSVAVEPGTYLLSITEPPRSIAFVWDNSGSVASFSAMTYAALDEFAAGITPELEEVMLAVFSSGGARFLLPDWSGDADEVTRALNAYDRSDGSSDAGSALIATNAQLAHRSGSRAVLLITDAEFSYNQTPAVWSSIEAAGTQIFSLHVSSASSPDTQDYMQDLADAHGGHYAATPTLADLETGLARADCLIRRPKPYSVSVAFEQQAAQPGQLSVSHGAASEGAADQTAVAVGTTGAIQVILDASGSMWQTLDGRFRHEIAAEVLGELVTSVLPQDVPFALRVFGNREANICRTDLEVALAPLDPDAVAATIAGIVPQSFAGTPLAESILLARADLAGAEGPRTLILITDGEESCDGDVEAAIAELRADGVDVVLNIIGFDFDADDVEAARARFRAWAELGGGQYFDATDATELADALVRSVALPFEVLDQDGVVVARGTVGGPAIDLPGGTYTLSVHSEPGLLIENVRIDGTLQEIALPEPTEGGVQ